MPTGRTLPTDDPTAVVDVELDLRDDRVARRRSIARHLAQTIAVAAGLVGTIVIGGWAFGVELVTSIVPGHATMKPNTASAFALGGSALWLSMSRSRGSRPGAVVLSAVVFTLGLVTFSEYVLGWSAGIDDVLFRSAVRTETASPPGRMAPATSFCWTLLGAALLLRTGARRPSPRAVPLAVYPTMITGFLAVLGYGFGAPGLYRVQASTSMALPTAVMIVALGIGILSSQPDAGPLRLALADTAGGAVLRRVIPATVVTVIALAVARLAGERQGLYGTEFGLAVMVAGSIGVLAVVVWSTAARVDELDRARQDLLGELEQRVEERTAELASTVGRLDTEVAARRDVINTASDAFISIDTAGVIVDWNPAAARTFGWRREEALGRPLDALIIPESQRAAHRAGLERFLRFGSRRALDRTLELEALKRDGAVIPIELTLWATPTEGGWSFNAFVRDVSERAAGASALSESEERYRRLADSTGDLVVCVSSDNLLSYVSPSVAPLLGWQPEDLLGKPYMELLEAGTQMSSFEERVQAGDDPVRRTMRLARADGTYAPFDSVSRLARNERTGEVEVLASLRNIETQLALQEALAASEQRLRLTAENAPIGLALVGLDGSWLEVNPAACEILGRSAKELMQLTFQDITHPDDVESDVALVQQLVAGEIRDYRMVKRYLRPDGVVVWAQLDVSLVRDEGGVPMQFISQIQDITGRRRDEEQLRLQARVLETMTEGVAVVRLADQMILFTTSALDAMYGYEAGELLGTPIATLNAADFADPGEVARSIVDQVERDGHWVGEVLSVRKDGSTFWRWASVHRLDLPEQGPVAVSLHADVTDRKAAEDALRHSAGELARTNSELARSNSDLQDFASVAAHDLKSPLTTIAGFASMLADGTSDELSEENQEYVARIVKSVTRMHTLVEDLLTYAKVGTAANRAPVDCAGLVADIEALLGADIAATNAQLSVGQLPTVDGDATQLRQLFSNLIANAVKFHRSDTAPVVAVTAERQGEEWLFTVSDNGIGIDRRHQDQVFKMFQRLHPSGRYAGTGIGLAICRRVVENHGGHIWFEPSSTGGSAFKFVLPAASPQIDSPSRPVR